METKKTWLLYDGRYLQDEERATVYEMCSTIEEARTNCQHYGDDTVIVECEVTGNVIEGGRIIAQYQGNGVIVDWESKTIGP